MNYQTEIDKYKRMYENTPETKWVTRRLIANKIDRLLQERSDGRERFFDGFEPPAFKIPIIEGRGLPPRDRSHLTAFRNADAVNGWEL